MYIASVTAHDKKNLPEMMLNTLKFRCAHHLLDRLVHAKDDIIRKIPYGWEMISHWCIPEEVDRLKERA